MTPKGEEKYPIPQQLSHSLLVHKYSSISLQPSAHHRTSLMARNHRITNYILSHKPTEAIDKKSATLFTELRRV